MTVPREHAAKIASLQRQLKMTHLYLIMSEGADAERARTTIAELDTELRTLTDARGQQRLTRED